MNNSHRATYRTRSLNAAAFLLVHEIPLIDMQREADGRCTFEFGGDSQRAEDAASEFSHGAALVNARRYADELRRLKAMIYGSV